MHRLIERPWERLLPTSREESPGRNQLAVGPLFDCWHRTELPNGTNQHHSCWLEDLGPIHALVEVAVCRSLNWPHWPLVECGACYSPWTTWLTQTYTKYTKKEETQFFVSYNTCPHVERWKVIIWPLPFLLLFFPCLFHLLFKCDQTQYQANIERYIKNSINTAW